MALSLLGPVAIIEGDFFLGGVLVLVLFFDTFDFHVTEGWMSYCRV